jgi:molybdopterin/thiamine biosynthesis adenylyltransferase
MPSGVLVVGLGGLGGAAATTLAAAGGPRLVLADRGSVEEADLGLSPLLTEEDVGRPRAGAAAARLSASFPAVEVVPVGLGAGALEPPALFREVQVVLEASRGVAEKLFACDLGRSVGVPVVHGGILRTSLEVLTTVPGGAGGCLRCLFEEPPADGSVPNGVGAGAMGSLSRLGGALMAAEALRLLSAEPAAYEGRLLTFEARTARARLVRVPRRPGCPACGSAPPASATAPAPAPGETR